jgi:hypothetical protein
LCTHTVGVLARTLEERGLTTLSISLVRRFTEMLRPPRALYVPFPFGMAMGHPGDAAQQHRVLAALFALLDKTPPVLEDLAGEAADDEAMSPTQASALGVRFSSDGADLAAEVSRLRHYQQRWVERTGRTAVGLTGVPVERFRGLVRFLEAVTRGERPDPRERPTDVSWAYFVRYASDDLKALYVEARFVMRPDDTQDDIQRWLWGETTLGAVLVQVRDRLADSDDPTERSIAYGVSR